MRTCVGVACLLKVFSCGRMLHWKLCSAFRKSLCTYKDTYLIERTIVSKNWIKQLHTSPVLHFDRCLTTEYSETTAHCNGDFGTDNQIYVAYRSLGAQQISERTLLC
jgi:hypothetical protein